MEVNSITQILILIGVTLCVILLNEIRKGVDDIRDYLEAEDPRDMFRRPKYGS
jgi:hypothetical protein